MRTECAISYFHSIAKYAKYALDCVYVCVCKWGILQSNNKNTQSHTCKVIKPISLPCWCIFSIICRIFSFIFVHIFIWHRVFLSSCALFAFTYDIYLWVAIFFHLYFFLFRDYSCEKGKCSWRFFRESMGLSWPILNEKPHSDEWINKHDIIIKYLRCKIGYTKLTYTGVQMANKCVNKQSHHKLASVCKRYTNATNIVCSCSSKKETEFDWQALK